MKKISLFIIITMITSIIPALSVSAADDWYLKGVSNGEYIVTNAEKSRVVTLVNSADKDSLPGSATGVDKVVFTYNDGDAVTDSEAPYEYNLTFDSCGLQTLVYDVYATGSSTPISTTVNFTTVAGTKNTTYSYDENFKSLTTASDFFGLNGTKAAVSGTDCTAEIVNETLKFTGNAKSIKQFSFKYAPVGTGTNVYYYEFDLTPSDEKFSLRLQKKFGTALYTLLDKDNYTTGAKHTIGVVLDYNSMIATVRINGKELKKLGISDFSTADPVYLVCAVQGTVGSSFVIDNFSLNVYNAKTPQEFSKASIPGGDENPVVSSLAEIRITGNDFHADQDVSKYVSIDNDADFIPTIDGKDVVVTFNDNLAEGTTYTLTIDGVKDTDLLAYETYTLIFRTLNPGENLPPEITLLSPISETRFYPGDTIELSAEATDSNGTVSYVEFYCDGTLIDGSRQEIGNNGVYTYEWVTDASCESLEEQAITALVCDNEGSKVTSSEVNIKILNLQVPSVIITQPENEKIYISNFGGVKTDVKPTIKFTTEDLDGEITNIEIFVDGSSVYSGEVVSEYTPETALAAGNHTIVVEVTDNDSQTCSDEIEIIVENRAKSGYILKDNLASEDLISKYDKVGTVKKGSLKGFNDIEGIIISSDNPTSSVKSSAKRTCTYSLSEKSFGLDVKVAFADTLSSRKIMLDAKELLTFDDNGRIIFSSADKGAYIPGEVYNLSAVVDYEGLKLYVFLDGNLLGNMAISATDFTTNEAVTIIHTGGIGVQSETAIIDLSISKMAADVALPQISLFTPNGSSLDISSPIGLDKLDYITVNFEGGADTSSLVGNLLLINNETKKRVNLEYSDGKFILCDQLKYASEYSVVVLPDARNSKGNGYSGAFNLLFETDEPADAVGVETVEVIGDSLNVGVFSATLNISFNGIGEPGEKVTVVYSAFNGSKMIASVPTEITVGDALEDANIPVSISGVNENTVIEVFVVDNMSELNPISDRIFIIK